ncbi:MAG: glycosyl hydrolase family 30, partial [Bacteroidales bacterium]|nr:glycosyl hydrolase family 30 [Bacteroidales bacterium]
MRNSKKIVCTVLLSTLFLLSGISQVKWMVTTEKMPWKSNVNPMLKKYNATKQHLVEIFPSGKLQQIDGFGGCFNERGMDALSVLPENKKQEVLKQLFDSISGCAFNICRMPIGANDYSMDYYSLNDTPE